MPGEIVTVIITVVGLVIFLLNQAMEGNDQQQRPKAGNDPRRQPRDEDINSFLREVAQRRSGRSDSRREPPPLPEKKQPGSTFSSSIEERSRSFSERVASDVSTDDVDSKIDDHIAETFKPHHARLESSLAGRYGARSGSSSGAMGAGSVSSASAQSAPGFMLDFPGLVGDPQALQRAIILQTIMQRPDDNWKS